MARRKRSHPDGVPLDAFLDALKASLIEARRRIGDRREAILAAEVRAVEREGEQQAMAVRLSPAGGATGKDVLLSIPHRCLVAGQHLQASELSMEFAVQVMTGEGGVPVTVELLDRRRARRGDRARLSIRLGDDPVTGSVLLNESLLKVF